MLGDMVALGIRLSDYGVGDYSDDVDAVVRNHLCEQQVLSEELLRRVAAASPFATAASGGLRYGSRTGRGTIGSCSLYPAARRRRSGWRIRDLWRPAARRRD